MSWVERMRRFIGGYAWYMVLWVFFSSRRRHTRWTGDWSSDVCSSDLGRHGGVANELMHHTFTEHGRELKRALFGDAALTLVAHGHAAVNAFSAVTRTERLDDGTGVGL